MTTGPKADDGVATRGDLMRAFGCLGDWLELVRAHEQERRDRQAEHLRRRRDQWAAGLAAASLAIITLVWIVGVKAGWLNLG